MEIDASYTWDNEGKMTSMTAPRGNPEDPSTVYNYQYDAMKRLTGMTGSAWASAAYGIAGEMTSFNGDTRTYNNLFQLTRIQGGGIDIEYRYTAGQNNGRIGSEKDWITGEEVTYTYDALNRLAKAETTDNTWGQAFGYDGFGNLTSKTVTKGSAPVLSTTFDPATNMPVGSPAPSFVPALWSSSSDVEDRKLKTWGEVPGYIANYFLSYDPYGKRMWRGVGEVYTGCEFYFYGIRGERLATYGCDWSNWGVLKERNVYFAGKPLTSKGVSVKTDRLGSVRLWGSERLNYYPYGEDRGTSANRREKFGTYFRDDDGTDYADQRYYGPGKGRFDTADPSLVSNAVYLTGNWNRFAYVGGDPINKTDPRGLCSPQDNPPCYSVTGTATSGEGQPWTGMSRLAYGAEDGMALPVENPDSAAPAAGLGGSEVGTATIANSRTRVVALLGDAGCASAIGATSTTAAANKAEHTSIQMGQIGLPYFTVDAAGVLTPGQSAAAYTSTGTIVLNNAVNWSNPGYQPTVDPAGKVVILSLGIPGEPGASPTADQYMDFYILHELAHSFGIKHPGTSPGSIETFFNQAIWEACFR